MSESTRRIALRAAAKVALGAGFSLGVWGCGASISEGEPATDATASEAGGPSEDAIREAGLGERPSTASNDASETRGDQETDGATPTDSAYEIEASWDGQAEAFSRDDAPTLACVGPVTLALSLNGDAASR